MAVLGTALALAGYAHEGATHWQKALELKPLYALPHKNLAVYYENEKQDHAKAEYHKQQFVRIMELGEKNSTKDSGQGALPIHRP